MRLEIVPLQREHFVAAAALLAARHRIDRSRRPELPAAFEEEAMARRALRDVLLRWTGGGVVALRRNRVVGYLVATLRVEDSSGREALHPDPRAAYVSIAGHAVDPAGGAEIYQQLYTALAPRWLAARCPAHYIDLPATDVEARETWQMLGFAPETVVAVRHLGSVPALATSALTLRRATAEDLESVTELADALARYHAGPPVFASHDADTGARVRQRQEALLADPDGLVLLAFRGDRAVGMISLSPAVPLEPISVPDASVFIDEGYTAPEARDIATVGLGQALAWARERGCTSCVTTWYAPNFVSARFCRAIGFRPLQVRLRRLVDGPGNATAGDRNHGP